MHAPCMVCGEMNLVCVNRITASIPQTSKEGNCLQKLCAADVNGVGVCEVFFCIGGRVCVRDDP